MSEDFGSDFITIVDDDGQEFELEVLDSMDYNGESYVAALDKSSTNNLWPGDEIIVGAKDLYNGKVVSGYGTEQ